VSGKNATVNRKGGSPSSKIRADILQQAAGAILAQANLRP